MVHGWYQNPFPTHTLKCPQSDERCRIARPSANQPRTTAFPFGRPHAKRIMRAEARKASTMGHLRRLVLSAQNRLHEQGTPAAAKRILAFPEKLDVQAV